MCFDFIRSHRLIAPPRRRRQRASCVDCRGLIPEHVGVHVSARYDLNGLALAEGSVSKVFAARDWQLAGRRVAVKAMRTTGEGRRALVRREAETMRELDHPNICRLLETFEHGEHFFFVMELCEGGDVFERTLEEGGLPEQLAADVTAQVASALRYAHGQGVAHRDVKPENVCFAAADGGRPHEVQYLGRIDEDFVHQPRDPHVKVIDWGLCGRFREAPMLSAVGSIRYAAPEVLSANAKNGGAYTSACDVWSLGVLAYVMLCAHPPFDEPSHAQPPFDEIVDIMRTQQCSTTGEPWSSLSGDAADFVRALLRPAPEDRLSIAHVLEHSWLQRVARPADPAAMFQALGNLSFFSGAPLANKVCRAALARQLNHRQLRGLCTVFEELDGDGDGAVSLADFNGFWRGIA